MATRYLRVFGASEHNLKNINVEIPRNSLTVITGLSGSGKSSLAFDTIYAEGQRRYVESLSAYARQFLEQLPKPHVEKIDGLSPAISIEQKTVSRNPRSTVGTVTEIYDYLRLLFATIGEAHCPQCGCGLERQNAETVTELALALPERTRLVVLAPIVRGRKGEYQAVFQKALKDGFVRAKVDGTVIDVDPSMKLKKQLKHDISLIVDRLVVQPNSRDRLVAAIRQAFKHAERFAALEIVPDSEGKYPAGVPWTGERLFSEALGCPVHGPQVVELAPRVFSFNSRYGACPTCEGIGTVPEVDEESLIPEPNLSLRRGAISTWKFFFQQHTKRQEAFLAMSNHAQQVLQVAEDYEIDPTVPWQDLSDEQRRVLLYGFRGGEKPPERKSNGKKERTDISSFRGLVGRLESRLEAADDDDEADELAAYLRQRTCPTCQGARLRKESLAVSLAGRNIHQVTNLDINSCLDFFSGIKLNERQRSIGKQPLQEITDRLGFLKNVGLHYLTLDRGAGTLSGGEAQRIRLATQIGSRLTGVLYILDEPSIGLHQRDNEKLIATLLRIRDAGNTVLVVEHDEQTIRTADHVLDLGPGAGRHGGEVIAEGTPAEIEKVIDSPTAQYLRGERIIAPKRDRRQPGDRHLVIDGCTLHNLRNVTLDVPLGMMVGITGVSGSGKSSLIMETLLPILMNNCYKASHQAVGPHRSVKGLEHIDRCINVDQSPIGRTPRSNAATYTKIFDEIRALFAMTQDAKVRGYDRGRFSFNTKGGRCEECKGQGSARVQMDFLPDVWVHCEACDGRRYNQETLQVKFHGRSIADVLEMTVGEAVDFFAPAPAIAEKLRMLKEVGLDYIHLGQAATTLSGGEAQRIKLARELGKRNTGRTIYILDEPTTGLHFADVHRLLEVLDRLVESGSTVMVIEHNLDVVKYCDWLIDLGPEGGSGGGHIIAQGAPEVIAATPESATGKFLDPAPAAVAEEKKPKARKGKKG